MSIAEAERLKRELTDKYVIVANGVPELRRFQGLTGTVKTVNMNGRALVQFMDTEDISWYDIEPSFLKVVDQPLPKKRTPEAAKPAAAEKAKAAKPAGKQEPAAGKKLSPLEMARQQGAGGQKAAAAPASAGAAPASAGAEPAGKKLSPLERARMQGAAGQSSDSAESAATRAPSAPASGGGSPPAGKKLSPLERARQEGAAKSADSTPDAPENGDTPPAHPTPTRAPSSEGTPGPDFSNQTGRSAQKNTRSPTDGSG